ncbi:MAG: polyphenol oxidase family protein, partial [Lachnospiraceae bacterium]|nr:polyphenol oxidase family protein [Lachnospiraceae bacterium]
MDIKWIHSDNEIQTVLHRKGDVLWLSHRVLDEYPWLINGSATRFGGVSTGYLSSMNLSFEQGDDIENVRTNYKILADAIGFDPRDVVRARQEHTTNVVRVTRDDCGRALESEPFYKAVDGFVTDEPGVILSVFYADCVPIYFVDPAHRAIGASHSGWRGTANWMAAVTVEKMRKEFGSDPAELKVVIGNCICRSCYTVNGDVALLFPESCYTALGNDQYKMDLPLANFEIL